MGEWRERVYSTYSSARCTPLVPRDAHDLQPRVPYLQRLIQRHFPEDRTGTVYDLGCGYGALLLCAQRAGYTDLRGVDGSPEQVQGALALGLECVRHGDLLATLEQIDAGSAALIVTFDVIEHFARADIMRIADMIYAALRPGGRWIIHAPNAESPFGARMRFWDLTHEIAFTRSSLGMIALGAGFRTIRFYEDAPVAHGVVSAVRAALWSVRRAWLRFWIAVETGETAGDVVFSQNLLAVADK